MRKQRKTIKNSKQKNIPDCRWTVSNSHHQLSKIQKHMPEKVLPKYKKTIKKRILTGTAWALTGKLSAMLLGLIVTGFLSRVLTKEAMGAYFLALGIVSLLSILSQAGLNQAVIRLVAHHMALSEHGLAVSAVRKSYLVCLLISVFLGGTFALGFGKFITNRFFASSALNEVIFLIGILVVPTALLAISSEIFRGFQNFREASFFSSQPVTGGFGVSLLLILLLLGMRFAGIQMSLPLVIRLTIISWTLLLAISIWILYIYLKKLGPPDRLKIATIAKLSMPILITNVTFYIISQADLWVSGYLANDADVALYGAASTMVKYFSAFNLLMSAVIAPFIAEMFARGEYHSLETLLQTTATIGIIPSLLLFLIFVFCGNYVLKLIFGPGYEPALHLLLIMGLGHLVNTATGNCGLLLVMTGNQITMMLISIFSALLMLVGYFFIGPIVGLPGIASISAMGFAGQNIAMLLAAKKRTNIWTYANFKLVQLGKTIITLCGRTGNQ